MTSIPSRLTSNIVCHEIQLGGRVQGVGFRPFVYRLARQFGVQGEVRNVGGRVVIMAQGPQDKIDSFVRALLAQAPATSHPILMQNHSVTVSDYSAFDIVDSCAVDDQYVFVPPDLYMCEACRVELTDPQDRRYGYPFINCTQCGPRYTLIKAMPYDRVNTTMAAFQLCPQCQQEYDDINNRRFHAEPLACPTCGPQLVYRADGQTINNTALALDACIAAILAGEIVAIKGIGGYHLCCDATNEQAINTLRIRKSRSHKPLAVMFPYLGSGGLAMIERYVDLDPLQAQFLSDPARPILLTKLRTEAQLSTQLAPGLSELGVMLPYSPLHHLLLNRLRRPIVATSANISGEPVLTDNAEAATRLSAITRHFLEHDREIVRPADDSVYRFINGHPRPVRIGRGVAPLELNLPVTLSRPLLACGGHMKNTVALAFADRIVIAPHIGDMGTVRSQQVFEQVVADLQALYQVNAEVCVCDAHPNYTASRWARQQGKPVYEVLHHHAHAACLAGEYAHESRWLVFTWDGVGYGADGTLWGGETFYGQAGDWQRVASMRPFYLPGGDKCAREPWRSALAIHWDMQVTWPDCPIDDGLLFAAWQKRIYTPQTTAVGRLFDAAAALLDVCQSASYEGQAPMWLEAVASEGHANAVMLPHQQDETGLLRTDWQPLFEMLMQKSNSIPDAAYAFHASLAQALCEQVKYFQAHYGDFAVGLCGGVFQNKLLSELVMTQLQASGYRVYLPLQVPINDGGLCYGQVIEAAARMNNNNA